MAKEYKYLKGKISWAQRLVTPDLEYKKWSVCLHPDQESMNIVHSWKEAPAILNEIKKDDDGYYITLSRPTERNYSTGLRAFTPPVVINADGTPCTVPIGNGSDATCKVEVYSFGGKQPGSRKGRAIRLEAVRIDNLIPYEPKKDRPEEEAKLAQGLDEQPTPMF